MAVREMAVVAAPHGFGTRLLGAHVSGIGVLGDEVWQSKNALESRAYVGVDMLLESHKWVIGWFVIR